MALEIKLLSLDDLARFDSVSAELFDGGVSRASASAFLSEPHHHLVAALDDSQIVGFAMAVDYLHPDQPSPELLIDDVSVNPSHQRRGIATSMLARLFQHARELGCSEAWVLAETDNEIAQKFYRSLPGGRPPQRAVMFDFPLAAENEPADVG